MTQFVRFARLPRLQRPPAPVTTRRRPAGRLVARSCAMAALAALAACHNFSGEDRRQADVVDAFYRIHTKSNAPGLPGSDELAQYHSLTSRALYTQLTQAEAAEARYRALAGPQAPPLIEGDLFTSLYEGATSFSVASCDSQDQRGSCQVDFRYKKDGADESWSDKVLLVQEAGQWRIDDIEFVGQDQSSQREYLTDTLADALQNGG